MRSQQTPFNPPRRPPVRPPACSALIPGAFGPAAVFVTFETRQKSEQRVFDEGEEAACSSPRRPQSEPTSRNIRPAAASAVAAAAAERPSTAAAATSVAAQRALQKRDGLGGREEREGKAETDSAHQGGGGRDSNSNNNNNNNNNNNKGNKDHKPRRARKAKKAVPSGTSLNWIEGLGTGRGAGPGGGDASRVQAEVTLSATGRMQGAVSKGVLTLRTRCVSLTYVRASGGDLSCCLTRSVSCLCVCCESRGAGVIIHV